MSPTILVNSYNSNLVMGRLHGQPLFIHLQIFPTNVISNSTTFC
uniref:Uncharacterized protein n=1 Tax=Glycine max TaxID=3847 RepID=C6TNC0_SOYBN|nr:unknown [Glycine max]